MIGRLPSRSRSRRSSWRGCARRHGHHASCRVFPAPSCSMCRDTRGLGGAQPAERGRYSPPRGRAPQHRQGRGRQKRCHQRGAPSQTRPARDASNRGRSLRCPRQDDDRDDPHAVVVACLILSHRSFSRLALGPADVVLPRRDVQTATRWTGRLGLPRCGGGGRIERLTRAPLSPSTVEVLPRGTFGSEAPFWPQLCGDLRGAPGENGRKDPRNPESLLEPK